MQVSVESPSHIERRLTIVVPFETVDKAFESRVVKIAKTAKIKGFRPGKVPLDHVRQLFGQTARQEALSEVIQSSLYTALNQEKLNPVGVPRVVPKNVIPGQPLEYVATIEVLPSIEKVNCNLDRIEKEITSPEEKDVDQVIQKLRDQNTKWNVVERVAKENDQVMVDFLGTIDNVPFKGGEAKNYPIVLGSKTMLPGFEDGLLSAKAGEERLINVQFPDNYYAKEVAGKKAQFTVQVKKVYEPELPALTDSFVKRLGVKSGQLDDLKNEIRKNLQRETTRLIKAKLKKKVFDKLLEQNTIEVPQSLIEREANRLHEQLHPHHPGEEHAHTEEEMASFTAMAKQNVILGLLIAELIKQHNIVIDKARVDEAFKEIASAYEKPEEVITMLKSNKKNRADIEMQVMEDQVLEKLLEHIQVTEKNVSYQDFVKTTN